MRAKLTSQLALVAVLIGSVAPVMAQTVEEFYKDRVVKFVVPFSAGGTSSRYTDLFARHFGRHIPGKPKIIPQHMPGGGGIAALNFAYTVAPRDGSVFFLPDSSAAINQLLNPEVALYDARKFGWIGVPSQARSVLMMRTDSGVRSVDDPKKKEYFLGSSGTGSETHMYPMVANGVIGTKFKALAGYASGAQVLIALEGKEIHGAVRSWAAWLVRPDLLENDVIRPILIFSSSRISALPDVPTLVELVSTEEDKKIVRLMTSMGTLGYGLGVPPDVPKERLAALRKAFDDMIADPEYLEDAKNSGLMLDTPLRGEDAQAYVAEVLSTPPELVERTRRYIEGGK